MLKREVITDPQQIAPLEEQLRSIRPMWMDISVAMLVVSGIMAITTAPACIYYLITLR